MKYENQVQLADSSKAVHIAMADHVQGGGYAKAGQGSHHEQALGLALPGHVPPGLVLAEHDGLCQSLPGHAPAEHDGQGQFLPGFVPPSIGVPGLGLPGQREPDHAVPGQGLEGHEVLGLHLLDHPVPKCTVSALIVPSVSIVQSPGKEEVARATIMQQIGEMEDKLQEHKHENKRLFRAAQMIQEWMYFWSRQRQSLLCLTGKFEGCFSMLSGESTRFSKCLNNTFRALSVKLKSASLMVSVNWSGTWFTCLCLPTSAEPALLLIDSA